MNLIIVESPTKAKTISKFLGPKYKVKSSFGHVRDLPKSKIGIDVDKDFAPQYTIPEKSQKIVNELSELAKDAEEVILATDEDREGEAIAWHLIEALGLPAKKIERIVFHEITKEAILEALKNSRQLDMNLVDAQQARRILDRLVGYKLSPFLWKKVARGLSAGRVQSVAIRLIVEREREIKAFIIDEYWSLSALLSEKKQNFLANLNKINGKSLGKLDIKNKDEAQKIADEIAGSRFIVEQVDRKQSKKNPLPPFTTSTLQQTANRLLGFSAKQTMTIAQKLYEGINIKGEGHVGLITYMRTDSLNLSQKFLGESRAYLEAKVGAKYALEQPRFFKNKSKNAQEAHEAIRPTEAMRTPESLEDSLDSGQFRLYRLIWQRAMASQMPEAIFDIATADISAEKNGEKKYSFRANGQVMRFDGYLKIYPEKNKDEELPDLQAGKEVDFLELKQEQHFTKPPARYSDAGLVKAMEFYGIGRPSTYAPTIATVVARNYVERDDDKRLKPTEIAFVVNDLLVNHFPNIVNYQFTAQMEESLDHVAAGEKAWQPVIRDFYNPFIENLGVKDKEINKKDIMPEEESEEICELCGAPMVVKTGRFGKFLSCSAYPECKNIKSMKGTDRDGDGKDDSEQMKELEAKYGKVTCDKCGAPMTIRIGKYGPFMGCSAYPKCKNIKNLAEGKSSTGIACPACGQGEIVQKRSRRGIFYACNRYPDCKTAFWSKPTGAKCPTCQSLLIENKDGEAVCSNKECSNAPKRKVRKKKGE